MNLFLLDKNENVLSLLPFSKVISFDQELEINQADVAHASLTLDRELISKLDDVRYFAVPDSSNSHGLWLYRKTNFKVNNTSIDLTGVNAFYDDLKSYGFIKDLRPNHLNAADAARLVIGKTRWNIDFIDNALSNSQAETHDTNFYYLTYLDALKKVEEEWTVEVIPLINIEGTRITRKYVNLYKQAGGNSGKRFVYGKSALEIVKQTSDTDVYTALIGRGSGVEVADDEGNATGGYSRKINFADVVWSKSNGDPVDKPAGQEWVEYPPATTIYGYSDGTPRFGIVEFDDEKDPANLLRLTWEALQKSSIPATQYEATVAQIGSMKLGETAAVVRPDLGIAYQTRVIKIDWDRKNENHSKITLGDKLINTAADRYKSVQSEAYKARDIANRANDAANFAITNGGTTTSWGVDEPKEPKEGDIWYKRNDDGSVSILSYDDGKWIIRIDDTTGKQIENKVDEAIKSGEDLKKIAKDAETRADNAFNTADTASRNSSMAINIAMDTKNGLSSKVSTDAFESKIKQISEGIETTVDDKVNKVIGTYNILPNTSTWDGWKRTGMSNIMPDDYQNTSVLSLTMDGSGIGINEEIILKPNTKYTISAYVRGYYAGYDGLTVFLEKQSGGYVTIRLVDSKNYLTKEFVRFSSTFTTDNVAKYKGFSASRVAPQTNAVGSLLLCDFKLEEGTQWHKDEPFSINSKITQLSNNIGLKVSKNDVVNQINISTEGILIDGAKTHITGQTTIDNAVIKNAMIDGLSASKLTAGVIDSNYINVVNLKGWNIDSNSITADKLAANSLLIGLNNDLTNMQFYVDGIVLRENGNESMVIDKTGMHLHDYYNNEDVGLIHVNRMTGQSWANGLSFDLNPMGDYMGWAVFNPGTNVYDLMLTYYRGNVNGRAEGIHIDSNLFVSGAIGANNGAYYARFQAWNIGGDQTFGLVSDNGTGILIGWDTIYLRFGGGTYNMWDVIHSIGRNITWN